MKNTKLPVLTAQESATIIGVSTRTFFRWMKKGIINIDKVGKFYTRKSVENAVNNLGR